MLREGKWTLRDPRATRDIRMNIGTITDAEMVGVRWQNRLGGQPLGEVEESFASTLTPGDTFLIGGQIVRFVGLREMALEVAPAPGREPKIAVFSGTKFSTSTQLSERILRFLQRPGWPELPAQTASWLALQREVSRLPSPDRLLVESFPAEGRAHLCLYGFAGRAAQQTLGLLLTRRMEDEGLNPLGFVATDYATLIWGLDLVRDVTRLLDRDALRAGLETWLQGNAVMKRTFRSVALVAGLIQRNHPGLRKSGRQATFSSDILYDTLQRYDPDHLLLQITREEAMRGLVSFGRVEAMLDRAGGRIDHVGLPRVSPFAAPLFLEHGKIAVDGAARERLLEETAARLMADAGLS